MKSPEGSKMSMRPWVIETEEFGLMIRIEGILKKKENLFQLINWLVVKKKNKNLEWWLYFEGDLKKEKEKKKKKERKKKNFYKEFKKKKY